MSIEALQQKQTEQFSDGFLRRQDVELRFRIFTTLAGCQLGTPASWLDDAQKVYEWVAAEGNGG